VRRLIFSDLLANAGLWGGVLAVAAAAAASLSVAAGLIATGIGLPLLQTLALAVLGSAVVLLTVIAALVVLGSVTRLTVTLQRRGYALWQLVGMNPAAVAAVVRVQLTLVALVGGALGCAVAAPFVPPFLLFGLTGSAGLDGITARFGVTSAAIVVLLVAVVVLVSSLGATRRAARTRPIEALREPQRQEGRMTVPRWIVAGLLVVVAGSMVVSLGGGDLARGGSQVLLIGPLVTAAVATTGPALFPAVLRLWTRVVPERVSASWFLARNDAAYEASRSAATTSALVVTIALPGSIYAGFFTFGNAVTVATGVPASSLAPQAFLLLLGGPLLLSLTGAAATIAMANRARERQSALVRAAGGTPGLVLLAAVWEAVIQVGTALIVSLLIMAVTGVAEAAALNAVAPGTAPEFGIGAAASALAVSAVLVLAATTLPALLGSRRSVREVLAAD